ncbi:hypothetical protein [Marinobacter sp. KMM 10035]|uniref:hypothetical protein n=1 Tax=Marinobacter sp. KMM 10035 TaxID=3134034 RepID=UPI00397BE14A
MLGELAILKCYFEAVFMEHELADRQVIVSDGSFLKEAVGIIRPSIPPRMELVGKLVKTKGCELAADPKQRSYEDFVSNTLNALARHFGKEKKLVVTTSLYLDPSKETGFPLFTVFSLQGAGVNERKISKFRAAMVFITSEITAQSSMFHESLTHHLTEGELALLSEECHVFSVKNSGKRITSEFAVYSSLDDDAGLAVSGQLPHVASGEAVTEVLDGLAWSAGYDEFSNLAFLKIIDGADSETTKISFQCRHTEVYDILARARLERSRVRYRGCRITSATGKKDQWRLNSVELAPADTKGEENFGLTPQ